MRIWDVDPGHLNRQSLLGEHRELHAVVSILANARRGYANHPETVRWRGRGWALRQRHRLLAAEMALRGYVDRTPVAMRSGRGLWPDTYVDAPYDQLLILAGKYRDKEPGRIPLPRSPQQYWSHHKYSVMARDVAAYRALGREVAGLPARVEFAALADAVTALLRRAPSPGGLRNALQHMWGHVAERPAGGDVGSWSPRRLLAETRRLALAKREPYLLASTALGELAAWLR